MRSAARSPIMIVGALVLPPGTLGITEASTTRRPSRARMRNCESTTARGPAPIAQVPIGERLGAIDPPDNADAFPRGRRVALG
jgi:hypothetical protein